MLQLCFVGLDKCRCALDDLDIITPLASLVTADKRWVGAGMLFDLIIHLYCYNV